MTATPKLRYFNWVQQKFHQLSIRQKIFCGYGLALGVAVLGTTAGLVIGDRYFQQARQQMSLADEEGSLLSSLQGQLLEIQIRQQEILPTALVFHQKIRKRYLIHFSQPNHEVLYWYWFGASDTCGGLRLRIPNCGRKTSG